MKALLLTLAGLMIGSFAFSQDLLGTNLKAIQSTTQGVKGIEVVNSGDSTLEVKNAGSQRFFKFILDPSTGLCVREEVQISAVDFENMRILDHFFNSKRHGREHDTNGTTSFETSEKMVQITHKGNALLVSFTLKPSALAVMASKEQDTNKSLNKD